MDVAHFRACMEEKKLLCFAHWGVAGLKQSLGSENKGDNVSYVSFIIFAP